MLGLLKAKVLGSYAVARINWDDPPFFQIGFTGNALYGAEIHAPLMLNSAIQLPGWRP